MESLSVPLATDQRFEQDACILTMVSSFLDCSGVTSHFLEEENLDGGMSEGTDSSSERSLSWSTPDDELSDICSVALSHWIPM